MQENKVNPNNRMKYDKETARKVAILLEGYFIWCDELLDHNYDPPKVVNAERYIVDGDITKVKRNEEPTLRGFLSWLKLWSI